jgi:8-oxo-dGTP pyrophosphatase MutT (NUDIX family)
MSDTAVPVRPAATVLLVRDAVEAASGGLEVCMLRRNLRSDFVGGAYVFPGGGVDDADGDVGVEALCQGWTDATASARLGIPEGGLAYWVAAVRESFEEAGLLLAVHSDGSPVDFADAAVAERFVNHRHDVDDGKLTIAELCQAESLRLDLGRMEYFGHWVTPAGAPRRYDTRFFLAPAPEGQEAVHDDHEVIAAQWITPAAALAAQQAGERVMLPPTIASLKALTRFDNAEEALAATAAVASVPTVAPRVVHDSDGVRILLPGDAGYEEAYSGDEALPSWPPAGSERA